jgi:hypothetical protein
MELYNEESELDRYVWEYFSQFMSEFEMSVCRAARAEFKAEHSTGAQANMLKKNWGSESDPAISEALSVGWPKYRSEVRKRVLRSHNDSIFVNRCPECSRIVRAPNARQCLWCGNEWRSP